MNINLSGKTVLVTGGTKGIGKSIVLDFIEAGAHVIIASRTIPPQYTFPKSDKINFLTVDFTDENSTNNFISELKDMSIDILINNAGINKIDLVEDIDIKDWDRIHTVNLKVPMLLCKLLAPKMAQKKWGRILNISSIFGSISKSKRATYSSTKFALVGFTKALALDYAQAGVLANCLSPGFIDTELTRAVLQQDEIDALVNSVPVKRLGSTSEISKVALFMCSTQNTFITAQNIIADGGFTSV